MKGVGSTLLVLAYHNVEPTPAFPGPVDAADRFRRQLEWIARAASVVPLADGLEGLAGGSLRGHRNLAITFDDGYLDNVVSAAPLLRARGLPATFFLVPEFLEGSSGGWWEDLARAARATRRHSVEWEGRSWSLGTDAERRDAVRSWSERVKMRTHLERSAVVAELVASLEVPAPTAEERLFAVWDEVDPLCREGLTVGSHSLSHAILARESVGSQRRDLAASREVLEERLGTTIDCVAYPNGAVTDFSSSTVAAASAAGFRWGLTTEPGWNRAGFHPFAVRRCVVEPWWNPARLAREMMRVRTSTPLVLAEPEPEVRRP